MWFQIADRRFTEAPIFLAGLLLPDQFGRGTLIRNPLANHFLNLHRPLPGDFGVLSHSASPPQNARPSSRLWRTNHVLNEPDISHVNDICSPCLLPQMPSTGTTVCMAGRCQMEQKSDD